MQDQRTNSLLEDKMYYLWENYFDDVPRKNLVLIHFGKYAKRQLGCIRWVNSRSKVKSLYKGREDEHKEQDDKRISQITLTRYFQDTFIPDFVVDSTIAHEMVHYAHGFNSPLPQLFDHPHRGNIVTKELIKRGLGKDLDLSNRWLKKHWYNYIKKFKS